MGEGAAGGLVACTIVAKNYLPFARVLAQSFRRHHPGGRLVVLLVDRVDGFFDPAAEPFELLLAEDLEIPDFPAFAFKYTLLEINTAVKPFFLARLLAEPGVEKLVYFDPDVALYRRLDELAALLDEHAIVLTPHLTQPIDDAFHPSEMSILQAGAYNLGFLALARGPEVERFLAWWGERVYDHCVVDVARGLFVDQKWVDLVPGLFAGVHVLTSPGYNVAYWNLHGRRVSFERSAGEPSAAAPEEAPTVNGEPLTFFHFSGVDPAELGRVSKHQNRFTLGSVGEARRLYADYRERLLAAGYAATRDWPYAFGRFADGVPIPDVARSLYFSLGPGRRRFGDPFAAGEGSFRAWANGPAGGGEPYLSRLLEHLWRRREDLVLDMPDAAGADLPRFAAWLAEGGGREYRLDEAFLEPLRPLLAPPARPLAAAASGVRRTVRRAGSSRLGRRLKFHLKRLLGAERAAALKRRLPGFSRPPAAAPGRAPLAALTISRFGVNVAGYVAAESGMGEGVRGVLRALERAGIPASVQNLELGVVSRMEDRSFGAASAVFDYDVNLLFVNADQVPHVAAHLGHERFRRKVNVGFWLWELEEFPRRWLSSFDPFHEIWTPSSFCLDAIASASPIPVRRVGLPVDFEPPAAVDRARLDLPADRFVFLFVFDFLSHFERKNPVGLVRAFKRAFAPDGGARLVLKTINASFNPAGEARLREEAAGWPVEIRDGYLGKDEVHALMAAADAYVSLHRSEGFGLTLAEAMRLGKPVIATDYSGPTDFMRLDNSYPVRYRLVELERDEGPYERGNRWAEPDLEHAAELMRRVAADPEEARRVGERARRDLEADHGVAATAEVIRRRLRRLVEQVNGPRGDHFGL
jgi:glycosyltransferase involved in cell wall biosynthesis